MTTQPYSFATNGIVPAFAYYNELLITNTDLQLYFPATFTSSQNYFSAYNLISAPGGSGNIILPDPVTGSAGNSGIFINISAFSITIKSFDNLVVTTIDPSQSLLITLRSNGEWLVATLGATTSQANASALAGNGLRVQAATPPKLQTCVISNEESIPFTINATYQATSINWNGGTNLITLPDATVIGAGFYFYVKNISSSNGLLSFQPFGTQTIDGEAILVISYNESCMIFTDGSNFYTIGLGNLTSGMGVRINGNGIQVVNGSAATPSYSFINFPNCGVYTAGNDIQFSVNGTSTVEINQNGVNIKQGAVNWQNIPFPYLTDVYGV